MKILITGAQGMTGRDLRVVAQAQGHEVWATDVEGLMRDPEDWLDITSPSDLDSAIERFHPDAIFHLAARTNVDGCERDPEDAWRVNAAGTENVALACRRASIPMLYVSTGSVFSGDKPTPYHEFDTPQPLSIYSRAKYAGEEAVRRWVPEHFIVRAGWMFGGGAEDKKFVAKMIEAARTNGMLRAVDDKFGSPTFTRDFSDRCLEIFSTGRFGTYHAANEGWCSRFEMARAIVEYAAVENCRVEACSSAQFPLAAHRPRLEALENLRSRLIGLQPMRPWREALKDYITTTFA